MGRLGIEEYKLTKANQTKWGKFGYIVSLGATLLTLANDGWMMNGTGKSNNICICQQSNQTNVEWETTE